MAEQMHFGLDLGMGAIKLFRDQQGIQLISQVAVPNGRSSHYLRLIIRGDLGAKGGVSTMDKY